MILASKEPGRVLLMVGIVFLVLAGVSWWFLYRDALHGYHEVWPVYLFAGVAIVCTGVWGAILAKLISRWT
jgi:hypothetical protein